MSIYLLNRTLLIHKTAQSRIFAAVLGLDLSIWLKPFLGGPSINQDTTTPESDLRIISMTITLMRTAEKNEAGKNRMSYSFLPYV